MKRPFDLIVKKLRAEAEPPISEVKTEKQTGASKSKGRPKTGKETLDKRVALTVKPSLYAEIQRLADKGNTTVNNFINRILTEYLHNEEI